MRWTFLGVVLGLASAALSQPAALPGMAETAGTEARALNDAAAARNAVSRGAATAADAAYAEQRARYEAALRQNAEARAATAAAVGTYEANLARYRADMDAWRKTDGRRTPPPPPSAPRQATASTGPPEEMICRKFLSTGSLVQTYRTCKPRRDWERERDNRRALGVTNGCGGPSCGPD